MKRQYTLITVNPQQNVPVGYWEAALRGGANVYGAAIVEEGNIFLNRSDAPTVQSLKDLRDMFFDQPLHMYLGNEPEPIDEQSRQPFVLLSNDAGEPLIVAFVEGDYDKHMLKDGVGSPEFYMVQDVLNDLVSGYAEATDGDVNKIMKMLANKSSSSVINGACGDRGAVVIVANNGEFHCIQKNDVDNEYVWGDVSRHHGFEVADYPAKEEPVVEEKVEPKKMTAKEKMELAMGSSSSKVVKLGSDEATKALAQQKTKLTNEILAQAKKEQPVIANTEAIHKPGATSTAIIPPNTVRLEVPRGKGVSNGTTKDFIKKYMDGIVPSNWAQILYIDVPLHKAPASMLPDIKPKDVTPKEVTSDKVIQAEGHKGSVPQTPPTMIVPVIPLTQIKAFNDTFLNSAMMKELLAKNGNKVPTEAELQEMEKAFPSWEEQTKLPIIKTSNWSHAAFSVLVRNYPDLAATLLGVYHAGYFKNFKAPVVQQVTQQDNQKTKNYRRN